MSQEETHMSKNRALSISLAAIATALTVGATSVYATGGGLTAAQVRAIVKQEVAKIPRGPAGPQGPAGMDGLPSLFAHVLSDGTVERASGIAQENVKVEERQVPDDTGQILISTSYCFIDLPPIEGGQVTVDGHAGPGGLLTPQLDLDTLDPTCPIRVQFQGPNQFAAPPTFFYILLY